MARRRHLIAYDIADPRRLRQVCKVMEAYGIRLQYSVFLCDLSNLEFVHWQTEIHEKLKLTEDSVVHIDLGAVASSSKINSIGVPRALPPSGPVIV